MLQKPGSVRHAPSSRYMVQVAQTERGTSEVSCVIDQDKHEILRANPMVHIDDTRPSGYTFAKLAVQTDKAVPPETPEVPDELQQTIGSHLWHANLELSAGTTPSASLKLEVPTHPNPEGPTTMTMNQLLDTHTQLEAARRSRDLSKILNGVTRNMRCLTKFSREVGLTPHLGQAHYLYACYLKSQISSPSPPSEFNLESVWSCQADLKKDMPGLAR